MRIFISCTPEELSAHRAAACEVAAEMGFKVVSRNPALGRGLTPVAACARQVAEVDAVLAIVGHRRGAVPTPEAGGDGRHPWSWWQTRAAFEGGKPVTVLLAGDARRPDSRDHDPRAAAVMRDFRGELARLATTFDGSMSDFRELVRRRLERCRGGGQAGNRAGGGQEGNGSGGALELFHRRGCRFAGVRCR